MNFTIDAWRSTFAEMARLAINKDYARDIIYDLLIADHPDENLEDAYDEMFIAFKKIFNEDFF